MVKSDISVKWAECPVCGENSYGVTGLTCTCGYWCTAVNAKDTTTILTMPYQILDYVVHAENCRGSDLVEFECVRMGEMFVVTLPSGVVLYFDGDGYLTGKDEQGEQEEHNR